MATSSPRSGPPGHVEAPDKVIYDSYKADRARRTLHGIDE